MFKRFKRKAIIYGLIFIITFLSLFSWAVNIFVGHANEEYWADRNAKRLLDGGEATEDGIPVGTTYVNGKPTGNVKPLNGNTNLISPLGEGGKPLVTSKFGYRNVDVEGASTNHKGIDIRALEGTAICSVLDGEVSYAGWAKGYGQVIYIKHADGVETRYAHLSSINVSVGDKVGQGTTIAKSGNTGTSGAAHLHFEVRIDGTAVDPTQYIDVDYKPGA